MTLADELAKTSNKKYALVEIYPKYRLSDAVSQKSGNIFEIDFAVNFEISGIEKDGVALTEVTTSNPSTNQYYYDEDTKHLEVNVGANPASFEVIMTYILRFTDSDLSVFSSKPYEPRLMNFPSVNVSVKNYLAGVPSISATSITIANGDGWLDSFMAGYNSWFNASCDVTFYVNNTVFFKYSGKVRQATPSINQVDVQIYDQFYGLQDKALMGDAVEDAYYSRTKYSDLDPKAEGKPIPYVIGRSAFGWVNNGQTSDDTHFLDTSKSPEAFCLDISNSLTWGLCRSNANGLKEIDYGDADDFTISVSEGTAVYGTGTRNTFDFSATKGTHNIELLDTIEIEKSSTIYQGVVTAIDNNSFGATDSFSGIMQSGAAIGMYDNVNANPNDSYGVVLVQGQYTFLLAAVDDYSISTEILDSGNRFYKVVLNSGFEAGHAGMNTINYETDRMYFRFTEDVATTDLTTHPKAMQRIIEAAGVTVNTTSFGAISTPTGSNIFMQIPLNSESDFAPYSKYIGLISESIFGFIYQDNDALTCNYELFAAPSASNILLENEILSLSYVMDGKEMGKDLRIQHPEHAFYYQYGDSGAIGADKSDERFRAYSIGSGKSKYFHGLINSKTQQTFCKSSAVRVTEKQAFLENEQMIVTFSTNGKYGNLNIGDSISLQTARLPGDKTTVSGVEVTPLVILGIKNGPDKTTFTAINFKGL